MIRVKIVIGCSGSGGCMKVGRYGGHCVDHMADR
jgi:hypothetical protein